MKIEKVAIYPLMEHPANQSFVLVVTGHLQEMVEKTTPACICDPAAPAANQASLSSARLIIGLGFVVGVAEALQR